MPASFTAVGLFSVLIIFGLVFLFVRFILPMDFIPVKRDFDTPCKIVLSRWANNTEAMAVLFVYLNGIKVGQITNGTILKFSTFLSTNELKVLSPDIKTSSTTFHAASGESVSIILEYPGAELKIKK